MSDAQAESCLECRMVDAGQHESGIPHLEYGGHPKAAGCLCHVQPCLVTDVHCIVHHLQWIVTANKIKQNFTFRLQFFAF